MALLNDDAVVRGVTKTGSLIHTAHALRNTVFTEVYATNRGVTAAKTDTVLAEDIPTVYVHRWETTGSPYTHCKSFVVDNTKTLIIFPVNLTGNTGAGNGFWHVQMLKYDAAKKSVFGSNPIPLSDDINTSSCVRQTQIVQINATRFAINSYGEQIISILDYDEITNKIKIVTQHSYSTLGYSGDRNITIAKGATNQLYALCKSSSTATLRRYTIATDGSIATTLAFSGAVSVPSSQFEICNAHSDMSLSVMKFAVLIYNNSGGSFSVTRFNADTAVATIAQTGSDNLTWNGNSSIDNIYIMPFHATGVNEYGFVVHGQEVSSPYSYIVHTYSTDSGARVTQNYNSDINSNNGNILSHQVKSDEYVVVASQGVHYASWFTRSGTTTVQETAGTTNFAAPFGNVGFIGTSFYVANKFFMYSPYIPFRYVEKADRTSAKSDIFVSMGLPIYPFGRYVSKLDKFIVSQGDSLYILDRDGTFRSRIANLGICASWDINHETGKELYYYNVDAMRFGTNSSRNIRKIDLPDFTEAFYIASPVTLYSTSDTEANYFPQGMENAICWIANKEFYVFEQTFYSSTMRGRILKFVNDAYSTYTSFGTTGTQSHIRYGRCGLVADAERKNLYFIYLHSYGNGSEHNYGLGKLVLSTFNGSNPITSMLTIANNRYPGSAIISYYDYNRSILTCGPNIGGYVNGKTQFNIESVHAGVIGGNAYEPWMSYQAWFKGDTVGFRGRRINNGRYVLENGKLLSSEVITGTASTIGDRNEMFGHFISNDEVSVYHDGTNFKKVFGTYTRSVDVSLYKTYTDNSMQYELLIAGPVTLAANDVYKLNDKLHIGRGESIKAKASYNDHVDIIAHYVEQY